MSAGRALELIEVTLRERELEYRLLAGDALAVQLPGERRLRTTCLLSVGEHALALEAFVMRRPDENAEEVYAYLLRHNARMYGVAWSIDGAGDVYLTGRVPLAALDADELDRLLGAVLEYADGSFNELLRLGFASSIRREWAWREKNGESLANLRAFESFARPR